ncbi:DUF2917 domain-containing protein [Variovorax sp. J22R133]|uniref:DUF2917 domain-containing protein n=1 Tax=Variovorax brevis TaxID=3053503 RepID=UPI002575CF22|nr:DUF2917 domain-containing protein [Variovorax sp. J22R133]MDM0117384.1 DUF2917 domain-containing protein [Variovorax sp. J22R133]
MKPNDLPHDVVTVLRQPRRIEPTRETVCVFCLNGTAWITIEGQLDDVILVAGDFHCVQPNQKALLAGMPQCRVLVDAGGSAETGVRG